MKTKHLFFTLIVIVTGYSYRACAQGHEVLFGNWGVDFTKTLDNMTSSQRTKFDKMTESAQGDMRKSFQGRSFSFKENGVVVISMTIKDKINDLTGKWFFANSENELAITIAGVKHSYKVEWAGAENVLLKYNDVPADASISTLYLTRK